LFCTAFKSFLLTMAEEKGVSRNFDNWMSPRPIGAPIMVITNNPPTINVPKAVKNPRKGMCQRMFPNVLIKFIFIFPLLVRLFGFRPCFFGLCRAGVVYGKPSDELPSLTDWLLKPLVICLSEFIGWLHKCVLSVFPP
jgi:hypothetical protein